MRELFIRINVEHKSNSNKKSNLWLIDKNNDQSQVTLSTKMGEFISIQRGTEL